MPVRELSYKIVGSPVGDLVIGASDRGCCLVEYVDREGLPAVKKRTEKRYMGVLTEADNSLLATVGRELNLYFIGALRQFSFPVDLHGSSFERAVWSALLAIPYGQTVTYGDVAKLVQKPLAAQAVGKANGSNPLAIIVPCHRVVQKGGGLRGYGGGIWRKQFLLDLELGIADEPGALL